MSTLSASTLPLSLSTRGARAPEQPIARLMGLALANPSAISLAAGFVDNATLPCDEVAAACDQLLTDSSRATASLQYGSCAGHEPLRTAIAERYFANDPQRYADSMLLTAGSNQFLQLASECLLDPGDIVLCAAPTYFVYLYVLRDIGAQAHSVGIDQEGMIPEALDAALRKIESAGQLHRVKALYAVPYFDNPSATTMSRSRREEILAVLARWRDRAAIMLLVDNAYRDLRYEGDDIPSFTDLGADPELTTETGTFSKNLSPGLRIGWGTPPSPLYEAMNRRKSLVDFGSPHFNQMLVATILMSGKFDDHLQVLKDAYRIKRDAMVAACDRHLASIDGVQYQTPRGGLYVWLRLPSQYNLGPDGEVWRRAMEAGVLYVPGEFFYAETGYPVARNTARLSFGVQTAERIDAGIHLLANAIKASK
jgi:2-aminoadipate transaminase